jgi:hypothetical protein
MEHLPKWCSYLEPTFTLLFNEFINEKITYSRVEYIWSFLLITISVMSGS